MNLMPEYAQNYRKMLRMLREMIHFVAFHGSTYINCQYCESEQDEFYKRERSVFLGVL